MFTHAVPCVVQSSVVKRKAKAVNTKIGGEFTQPRPQATKKKKRQQEEAPSGGVAEDEKKKSRAKVRYAPTQRKSRKNDFDANEFSAKPQKKAKTKLKTKKRYRKRH